MDDPISSHDDTDQRLGSAGANPAGADCQRLQAMFGRASHCGLRGVQVRVDHDRILLSGTVRSYYLKQMAQEQVRQACPHVKLSNDVVVQPQS